jgi:hypothetical protein
VLADVFRRRRASLVALVMARRLASFLVGIVGHPPPAMRVKYDKRKKEGREMIPTPQYRRQTWCKKHATKREYDYIARSADSQR